MHASGVAGERATVHARRAPRFGVPTHAVPAARASVTMHTVRVYLVGGAVRDRLLGLPVHERDWVVVGARPEELVDAGYQPVGREFPVFLHPETHE
ncbi:MAG TPA: hypothetical protein VKU84_05575, partial [Stellaceae bacterium]|nr:hypothetical protein [Stellaceae bacterium]